MIKHEQTIRMTPVGKIGGFLFIALSLLGNVGLLASKIGSEHVDESFFRLSVTIVGVAVIQFFQFMVLRDEWAVVKIAGEIFEHRRLLAKKSFRVSVKHLEKIVLERSRFYKSHGSLTQVTLVAHVDGKAIHYPLAKPWFFGRRGLELAYRLAQELQLPIDDPVGSQLAGSRFFLTRWKVEGREINIVLLILALGTAAYFLRAVF